MKLGRGFNLDGVGGGVVARGDTDRFLDDPLEDS